MGVKFVAAATGPAAREAGPKKGLLSMLVVTLTLAALYVIFLVVIARRLAFYQRPRWFKVTLALLLLVAIIARLYRYNSAMGIDYDEAMGGSTPGRWPSGGSITSPWLATRSTSTPGGRG